MVSIIIPAYNEERRLPATLDAIKKHFKNTREHLEIIVVDDGSKDETVLVANKKKARVLKNGVNRGKGYSVRSGMLSTNDDTILFTDADNSTPIEEYEKLKHYLKTHDVIIASREKKGARRMPPQPPLRRFVGRVFSYITQLLLLPGIQDSQCGFKLFTKKTARDIFSRCTLNGFGFDVEALYVARTLGYRIKEVPVTWKDSKESKVSAIKDSYRMLIDVLKVRWKGWTGGYR